VVVFPFLYSYILYVGMYPGLIYLFANAPVSTNSGSDKTIAYVSIYIMISDMCSASQSHYPRSIEYQTWQA
jgi:hypothetical protein